MRPTQVVVLSNNASPAQRGPRREKKKERKKTDTPREG